MILGCLLFCSLPTFVCQMWARPENSSSNCQFYYRFHIPIVDLTADIILTELENFMEWVCLIRFLTELLKNCFPAPNSPPLCNLDDTVEQKIRELVSQWSLSFFHGLCPGDPLIIWRSKALTLQKTSAPQGLSSQSTSTATLAYLEPVGIWVAPHICKATSYDDSPCDSNLPLLKSSHTGIQKGRECYIPGSWL